MARSTVTMDDETYQRVVDLLSQEKAAGLHSVRTSEAEMIVMLARRALDGGLLLGVMRQELDELRARVKRLEARQSAAPLRPRRTREPNPGRKL